MLRYAFLLCVALVAGLLISAGWCPAETVWIAASSAERLVGPVVLGANTGLAEEGALGDYLVSTVCVDEEALTGGHAEFAVDLPAAGRYTVWARVRSPLGLGESFAIIPESEEPTADLRLALGDDGTKHSQWHWVSRDSGKLALDLPAGRFRFRIYAREAHDTVFAPGGWTMARPMFNPRLNVVCLTSDSAYVPTDADARRALGVQPSHFSDKALRAAAAPLPPLSPDDFARLGKKPIPDWLRCPRFYTKDAWRDELAFRKPGDIGFMVRQIAACEGNAFRLAAYWGGDAYFQSRTAPHAPGLDQIDYLGEATEMGRRLGVHTVMYVNPNCLYEDHPLFDEALVRRADGSGWGGDRYGIRGAHFVCINNPAYREMLRAMLDEAFTRYELAGLYVDGLTPHRCFCRHCRAKYREMFAGEMPVEKLDGPQWTVLWEMVGQPQPVGDPNDPDTARYTEFLYRSLADATAMVSETVRRARPGAVTLYHSWPKPATLADYDGTLTEIYVKSPWRHSLWKFGELSSYSNVFSIPVLFNIYLHDHGTAAEARTKMVQGLAGGCFPNFWNTLGMKPMFHFMRENAECFDFARTAPTRFAALPRGVRNESAHSRVASDRNSPRPVHDRFLAPYVGMYSAVVRSGLPIVSRQRSDFHRDLDGFQVLLLANEACLSDEQAEAVRRFVAAGGGLVATHETSLYDERGNRREDFALADVFGVHYERMLPPAEREVRFDRPHAVTDGLLDGPAIAHDDVHAAVRLAGAEPLAVLVEEGKPGVPAVTVHQFGKGRVVYLPGRLDAIQCDRVTPAVERLVGGAVRWASSGNVPAEAHADEPVAVTSFDQPDRRVVHLVSLAGDTLYRSDAVAPAGRVTVTLHVPDDRRIAGIRRLWAKEDAPFDVSGRTATVVLDDVGEYEVLAVEWK
jgi:hypothetical protein